MKIRTEEVARLVRATGEGDQKAAEALLTAVYDELHALAHRQRKKLGRGGALRTTDLVHEAWLRLLRSGDPCWENRRHFFGAAARAMHNILVEDVRRRRALKRDTRREAEAPTDLAEPELASSLEEALSVGEALRRLEVGHERPAEVVWLRFFDGLSMPEVAEILGVSLATAEREWRFARAWLQKELGGGFRE